MAQFKQYDIIFAGGGTAGCLTASRLAVADPSLRILVLEAGPHTRGLQDHIQPARFVNNLKPGSKTFSFNFSRPSQHLNGRSVIVPCGRCVGGGSSVNFMMYTRASASDYDDWEAVYGNHGWGSKDLIPLLKKTETYEVTPDQPLHGYSGPLRVSHGGAFTNVGQQWLDVAAKYDKERAHTSDVNALHSCNEYGRWPKWIGSEEGKRSDVAHHFIYNQDQNNNLEVLDGCRVKRVVIKDGRAVGVEYVHDPQIHPGTDQQIHTAHASRLVVVSAGAFGSPTILERSGIGSVHVLEKASVTPIVELPGVGENYQDHNLALVPYLAADEAETLDAIFREEKAEVEVHNAQWIRTGQGLMAHNTVDAGIKLRPNAEELETLGPEFLARWHEYFEKASDKPVMCLVVLASFGGGDRLVAPRRKYLSACYYSEYPLSVGSVHIKSGDDPFVPADFDAGFLSNPADLPILRWVYKKSRELVRRMGLYRGEFPPRHPTFTEGSAARCGDAMPVDVSSPDIVYEEEDDKAIDAYHRQSIETAWHSMGTCAMKPREQGGVVDEKLNVYGVQNLKVADLSICPSNVGANTYSTTLGIGEKAAVLIAEELGIEGV